MHILRLLGAVLALMIITTVAAFAQDATPDTIINLGDIVSPWLQLIFTAASVIIPAAALWAAAELRRRTGITIEASHRDAFQTALTNAAGLLLAKAGDAANGIKIDARNPAIKEAVLYVNKSAPDALAYFGLSPDQIAEKIAAKIGTMTASSPPTVPGS